MILEVILKCHLHQYAHFLYFQFSVVFQSSIWQRRLENCWNLIGITLIRQDRICSPEHHSIWTFFHIYGAEIPGLTPRENLHPIQSGTKGVLFEDTLVIVHLYVLSVSFYLYLYLHLYLCLSQLMLTQVIPRSQMAYQEVNLVNPTVSPKVCMGCLLSKTSRQGSVCYGGEFEGAEK